MRRLPTKGPFKYLVFCWTFIPAIVGLVEGIIYLTKSDAAWAAEMQS